MLQGQRIERFISFHGCFGLRKIDKLLLVVKRQRKKRQMFTSDWIYLAGGFNLNKNDAPISRGCTLLHPGYGFLSENAVFVEMCTEHGINFIGTNPESTRVMGEKSTARDKMKNAGVRTVPGSDGLLKRFLELWGLLLKEWEELLLCMTYFMCNLFF